MVLYFAFVVFYVEFIWNYVRLLVVESEFTFDDEINLAVDA